MLANWALLMSLIHFFQEVLLKRSVIFYPRQGSQIGVLGPTFLPSISHDILYI